MVYVSEISKRVGWKMNLKKAGTFHSLINHGLGSLTALGFGVAKRTRTGPAFKELSLLGDGMQEKILITQHGKCAGRETCAWWGLEELLEGPLNQW